MLYHSEFKVIQKYIVNVSGKQINTVVSSSRSVKVKLALCEEDYGCRMVKGGNLERQRSSMQVKQ